MKAFIAACCLVGLAGAPLPAQKMKVEQLPPAVQTTVRRQLANAALVGLAREIEKGKTVYELETKVNGKSRDLMIDSAGKVLSVEEEVAIGGIPSAARAAIEKAAAGGRITRVEALSQGGKLSYEAAYTSNGKSASVTVTPEGQVTH